ncbi:hypothetical protein EUTSA_v10010037mg [Eutrema salsugineum]|uniref:Uncharacterized protein n=1 Tax=Eutrema salsugineum TaxID=72664 RepID=V4MRG8_EUTSA|nr:hypothetical protein EUTSA_v10010037mg [Eutrema salsugineum]
MVYIYYKFSGYSFKSFPFTWFLIYKKNNIIACPHKRTPKSIYSFTNKLLIYKKTNNLYYIPQKDCL